jgi:hypothetical protein
MRSNIGEEPVQLEESAENALGSCAGQLSSLGSGIFAAHATNNLADAGIAAPAPIAQPNDLPADEAKDIHR